MAKPQTTADIAARRARVAALRHTMSNRAIAAALGVAESTVRRDLAALDAEARAAEQATAPTHADAPRHDAPTPRRLVLDLDDDLAAALRVLVAAMPGVRHTPATERAAARAAIRATADGILAAHAAGIAAAAPSGRAAAPRAQLAS